MADQQEIFAVMKGTVNGVLDQIERERRNLKSENEELKNENTFLKTKMEEKGNKFQGEVKKLNEELSTAKKTIALLDPTGTGQRIVNHANLFQTKEIDKLTEKIVGLEAKTAKQLELIEVLQRVEFELRAELTNISREQANSVQAMDRTNRKRKAETSLEVNEKQSRIEK